MNCNTGVIIIINAIMFMININILPEVRVIEFEEKLKPTDSFVHDNTLDDYRCLVIGKIKKALKFSNFKI